MTYTPLHMISHYTVLQSAITIPDLAVRAAELELSAAALTDRDSLGGMVPFIQACQVRGLKPLLGVELSISWEENSDYLVLLARDELGLKRLLDLVAGPKPVPITKVPEEADDAFVVLVGGRGSLLHQRANQGDGDTVRSYWQLVCRLFGQQAVYVELDRSDEAAALTSGQLLTMLPAASFAAAQRTCYLRREQEDTVQALTALRERIPLAAAVHYPAGSPLLEPTVMAARYADVPEALANTRAIAAMCTAALPQSPGLYQADPGANLEELVRRGAARRYGQRLSQELRERIRQELDSISSRGFADYFLLVHDVVTYARQQGIAVGPGRGSAAASVVSFCLGITDVEPMQHNLLFERFLNPARPSPPDIDIDICYERRQEVIAYLFDRCGQERAAQVGAYSTFGFRSAVQEAGRLLETPTPVIRRIVGRAKKLSSSEDPWSLVKGRPDLYRLASGLAGLIRSRTTHAAGFVVSAAPLRECCPLYRMDDGRFVTQCTMEDLDALGLVKVDLLGLKTLTFLAYAEELVRKTANPDFCLSRLDSADAATFRLLQLGATADVFQLESSWFRRLLQAYAPADLSDLMVVLALGRPGPHSITTRLLERRFSDAPIAYTHSALKPILEDTYGFMIYQEQVIQTASSVGGLSLAEADLLRAAMSKGERDTIHSLQRRFLAGAKQHGLDAVQAQELFDQMEQFADYAFNKAHSAAYARLVYAAAYLKANFPTQFMAAVLRYHNQPCEQSFIEALAFGADLLAPNVTESHWSASTAADGRLRLGLGDIQGVTKKLCQHWISERERMPFADLDDFVWRAAPTDEILHVLLYSGALDAFGERHQLQQYLVGLELLAGEPLSPRQLLEEERKLLGAYLSQHPAARWDAVLQRMGFASHCAAAGQLLELRQRPVTRSSARKVRGVLAGTAGLLAFAGTLPADLLDAVGEELGTVLLVGNMAETRSCPRLDLEWIWPLRPCLGLTVKPQQLQTVKRFLQDHRGYHPVYLQLPDNQLQLLPPAFWVEDSPACLEALQQQAIPYSWLDPWQERTAKNRSGEGIG